MLKFTVVFISFVLLSSTAVVGILPEIRDSLGISQTQSELLISVPSIATLVFVIVSDMFIKRIGLKKTVVIGLVVSGLSGLAPLLNDTGYGFLLISRFLFGAGKGLIYTPSVNLINSLFKEGERPSLIGYRSATEMLGQSLMTFGMGLLIIFGWRYSFLVNSSFFLIAFMVWKFIPNNKNNGSEMDFEAKRVPGIVFPLSLFIGLIALSSSMIAFRFPAMLTEIRGPGYNASFWVALKPILGIIAASFFGKLYFKIGKNLMYIGTLFLIISQLMFGFSNNNYTILVVGFLLSSFVLGWIIPVIINLISRITNGKQQRRATALILVCANVGIFIMPFWVNIIEMITNNTQLTAPYSFMSIIVLISIIIIITTGNNNVIRKKVGLYHD